MAKNPKGGQGKGGPPKVFRESKTGRFKVEKSDRAPGDARVYEFEVKVRRLRLPPDPRPPKEKK